MRTVKILGKDLQVPSSVQDWELYDIPGATAAADDLIAMLAWMIATS